MTGRTKRPVVLVVEDDPMILDLTTDMIDILGYDTIPAPNADIALKILEHGEDVCAIVTDIAMPGGMDGLELARTISVRWPRVGIVIASGRLPDGCGELPNQSRFVRKPYDLRMVEGALHQVLS